MQIKTKIFFSLILLAFGASESYSGKELTGLRKDFLGQLIQMTHVRNSLLEFLSFCDTVSLIRTNKKIKECIEGIPYPEDSAQFLKKLKSFQYFLNFHSKKENSDPVLQFLFEKKSLDLTPLYKILTSVSPLIVEVSDLYPSVFPERWKNLLDNLSESRIYWAGSPYLMNKLGWPKRIKNLDLNIPYDFSANGLSKALLDLIQIIHEKSTEFLSVSILIHCASMDQYDEVEQQKILDYLCFFRPCHSLRLIGDLGQSYFFQKIAQRFPDLLQSFPALEFFGHSGCSLQLEDLLYFLNTIKEKVPGIRSIVFCDQKIDQDNFFESIIAVLKKMPALTQCDFSTENVMKKITYTGLEYLIPQLFLHINSADDVHQLIGNLSRYPNLKIIQLVISENVFLFPPQIDRLIENMRKLSFLKVVEWGAWNLKLLEQVASSISAFIPKIGFFFLSADGSDINCLAKIDVRSDIEIEKAQEIEIEKARDSLAKIVCQRFQNTPQIAYFNFFFHHEPLVRQDLVLYFLEDLSFSKEQTYAIDKQLAEKKDVKRLGVVTCNPEMIYYVVEKAPSYIQAIDLIFSTKKEKQESPQYLLDLIEHAVRHSLFEKKAKFPLIALPCCSLNQKQIFP